MRISLFMHAVAPDAFRRLGCAVWGRLLWGVGARVASRPKGDPLSCRRRTRSDSTVAHRPRWPPLGEHGPERAGEHYRQHYQAVVEGRKGQHAVGYGCVLLRAWGARSAERGRSVGLRVCNACRGARVAAHRTRQSVTPIPGPGRPGCHRANRTASFLSGASGRAEKIDATGSFPQRSPSHGFSFRACPAGVLL